MNLHISKYLIGRLPIALCLAVAISLLTACLASPEAPDAALTSAREAIASAEQAGARHHAAAELDEAKQQLLKAERAVTKEQMTEAERFAHQSLVTAQLATAKTESIKAVAINREMDRSAEALTEEMQRKGEQQ